MTRAERLKLAKAARELAMECVAGTAPKFDGRLFYDGNEPACALAHIEVRAGAEKYAICNYYVPGGEYFEASAAVTDAVYPGLQQFDGAEVFPLLWLADELESRHD